MADRFPREKGEYSERLSHLSKILLSLHKRLLDTAREEYVRTHGEVDNAFRMLALVMEDPYFAWLRPVSQLIVRIDELAETETRKDEVDAVVLATKELLTTGDFAARYPELLQLDAEIVIIHAQLQKALGRFDQ